MASLSRPSCLSTAPRWPSAPLAVTLRHVPEPISLSAALGLSALGHFLWDKLKDGLKDQGKKAGKKALERTLQRLSHDGLPSADRMEEALHTALQRAVWTLACYQHEPSRRKLGDLAVNLTDWPAFACRVVESVQGDVLAGEGQGHWLSALIAASKDRDRLRDLPFHLASDGTTALLSPASDTALRDRLHREFLAWVKRQVPDNGHKPSGFATAVRDGSAMAGGGKTPPFYDLVCGFFREQLQTEARAFRDYTTRALADLRDDLATHRTALPDAETLQRLTEALTALAATPEASYAQFQRHLERENDRLLDTIKTEFAGVHGRLKWLTVVFTRQQWVVGGLVVVVLLVVILIGWQQQRSSQVTQQQIRELRQQVVGFAETNLQQQSKQGRGGSAGSPAGPVLDFPAAYRETATRFHISPEEAQRVVEQWIAEVRATSTNLTDGARAEFLAQHFAEAARLSDAAAADKLARRHQLAAEHRRLTAEAVDDLTRAGESLRAQDDLPGARARFTQAVGLVTQADEPERWATLQIWLGIVHDELGSRIEGPASRQYLQVAVTAYQAALDVYVRAKWPQSWAMIQGNLGNAFLEQAKLSDGATAVQLLDKAASAYRATIKVRTREQNPQAWAAIQCSLGNALRAQARLHHEAAVQLLDEAVTAYRAALEVRTRAQWPQAWAVTQCGLGNALSDQAARSGRAEASRLLSEAVTVFRAALKELIREQWPQDWAMTQNNLGNALSDQAWQSDRTEAVRLLSEAITTFRLALKVYTREQQPKKWALTQNNLGLSLLQQARLSMGTEAVQMVNEVVEVFHAVLEVQTRTLWPQDWAGTQYNLGLALCDLAGLSDRTEAVKLLVEAVMAYQEALKVFTELEFRDQHGLTSRNLARAEAELKRRQ